MNSSRFSVVRPKGALATTLLALVIVFALVAYATYHPGVNNTRSTSMSSNHSISTSTENSSSSSSADSQTVIARVQQFGIDLANLPKTAKEPGSTYPDAKSVHMLVSLYSNSSVVTNAGVDPFNHQYPVGNLTEYYELLQSYINYSQATISNLTTKQIAPHTIINSSFTLVLAGSQLGLSALFWGDGAFTFTIYVQQQWVNQGGSWTIQRESWNWLKWWAQHPPP